MIKTEISKTIKNVTPPLLMQHIEGVSLIIVATYISENYIQGFVLKSELYHVGHHKSDWKKNLFIPYQGSITLSNVF